MRSEGSRVDAFIWTGLTLVLLLPGCRALNAPLVPEPPPPAVGSIPGIALDAQGNALNRARVEIFNYAYVSSSEEHVRESDSTNSRGEFELEDVVAGRYDVEIIPDEGIWSYQTSIDIGLGDRLTLVHLPQAEPGRLVVPDGFRTSFADQSDVLFEYAAGGRGRLTSVPVDADLTFEVPVFPWPLTRATTRLDLLAGRASVTFFEVPEGSVGGEVELEIPFVPVQIELQRQDVSLDFAWEVSAEFSSEAAFSLFEGVVSDRIDMWAAPGLSTFRLESELVLLSDYNVIVESGTTLVVDIGHRLTISVVDSESRPVAGAEIQLFSETGGGSLFLTTDLSGVVQAYAPSGGYVARPLPSRLGADVLFRVSGDTTVTVSLD